MRVACCGEGLPPPFFSKDPVKRPKLLFLCQTLPFPPNGGVWIRTYHILRLLARAFDVTALCFERGGLAGRQTSEQQRESVRALSAFGTVEVVPLPQTASRARYLWNHVRSILAYRVYTRFMYDSREFRNRLNAILAREHFDLVHLDSLNLSGWIPALDPLPVICVHHDVESALLARRATLNPSPWRRRYLEHQARLMRREERTWCPRVALNVTVSEADAELLQRIVPNAPVAVVPNGVDIDEFRPAPGRHDRITFVGGTAWLPNLDALQFFCEQILPRLRAARPDLPRIQWVGFATPDQQEYYGRRFSVELTGYVPDVRPFMSDSVCNIVPLRAGGGTRIKILNAWAMGNAVVSTTIGCEGLAAKDGDNVLIADEPAAFAKAILRVLDDAGLRARLGRHGRATAEAKYSWDVIGGQMTATYFDVAVGRRMRRQEVPPTRGEDVYR